MSEELIDAEFLGGEYVGPRTLAAAVFSRRLVSTVKMNNGIWYETLVVNRDGCPIEARHYFRRKDAMKGHHAACEIYLQSQ